MIVILNNTTHVGANPPSDPTKTWISADMTEILIYPKPETYGRLNERIDVKAILLAHNLDIKSDRIRVFSLDDDVLEVKRYVNGEWIVVDNSNNFVNILMNDKIIGIMEVDTIAPGEQVEEWDGSGVVIEEIATEEADDELVGTWVFNNLIYFSPAFNASVEFTSFNDDSANYETFTSISIDTSGDFGVLKYGNTSVARESLGFYNDSWRFIDIISEPTDEAFITWLKANATKQ